MTVSYNIDVSRNSIFSALRLLFRWKGSVWKAVWKELLVWLFGYYIVFLIYRSEWILSPDQQRTFEKVSGHLRARIDWIPLNFLLGFFVSMVVDRWRQVFLNMGFIENLALSVACLFRQKEENDRLMRRAIVRYLCLAQILVFRDISLKVRKRFPNMDAIIQAGFLEEHELVILDSVEIEFNKYFIPINWAGACCMKARETGRLNGDNYLQGVLLELKNFRTQLAVLQNFDWVPVPLAYPQLVICAVRVYFLLCLVARQYIIGDEAANKSTIDLIFPLMTVLQFIFYIGWAKVAESLLNPMGEDDDHFECNYLIDRNISIGLWIVDDTHDVIPEFIPDRFVNNNGGMYTEATAPKDGDPYNAFVGSVAHIVIAREDEQVDMVTVVPKLENDETPSQMPSRKTSFANGFGSKMQKKFSSARRNSRFTAHVVPSGVSVCGSGSNTPTRARAAALRRASEKEFGDGDMSDISVCDPFSASRNSSMFGKSLNSRRMSVPMNSIREDSMDNDSDDSGTTTPSKRPSLAKVDASRHPTICEEEDETSNNSQTTVEEPTADKKEIGRPTVTISSDPTLRSATTSSDSFTPPMTPRGILKKSGEGASQPSSRGPSQPPSRDPHLASVAEEEVEELSVAEAVKKVLADKTRLSQEEDRPSFEDENTTNAEKEKKKSVVFGPSLEETSSRDDTEASRRTKKDEKPRSRKSSQ